MFTTAYRRYLCAIGSITVLLAIADAVLLRGSNVWIGQGNAYSEISGIALGVIYVALGKMAQRLSPRSALARAVLTRVGEALESIGVFLALFFAFTATSCLFMYLAAASQRPLMDGDLSAIDQMLGFDWLKTVELANSSPAIAAIMVFCYASIGFQIPLTALYHVATSQRDRLFEFATTLVISLLLTDIVMLAIPSAGAYSFYRPDGASFSHFTAVGGLAHLSTLEHLRSGLPFEFLLTKVVGLTSFPSFHTALGILVVYAARRTLLFWPVAIINGIMIAATVPEGGHHLVDVIGGACVAAVSIAAVRRLAVSQTLADDRSPSASSPRSNHTP